MHPFTEGLQGSFRQLRRRRLARIGGAYVFFAWLTVQIADILFPALFLPEWSVRLVLAVAIIGLPFVLVVAWATEGEGTGFGGATAVRDWAVAAALVGAIGFLIMRGAAGPSAGETRQIAVLPLTDVSREGDQRYLGDGIAGELLDRLARIEGLRVVSRTSSFAYRDRQEDVRTIGRDLGVDAVVEGSVRREGNQLRVTARLTAVRDGFTLWSDSYSRELDDLFVVQDDIARSISEALQVELLGPAGSAPQGVAYDLYLKGRHLFRERTPASLREASRQFAAAIERDPDFALAYSGYADSRLLLSGYGNLDAQTALAESREALEKGLAIGRDVAELNASLGLLNAFSGEMDAAELAYRRAIELDPKYAMAHMWLGTTMHSQGRLQEALTAFAEAGEAAPGHPIVGVNQATVLFDLGRYDDGMRRLDELARQHPQSGQVRRHQAMWMGEFGRLDHAVLTARRAVEIEPESPLSLMAMAKAWLWLEDPVRARAWLDRAREVGADNMLIFGLEAQLLLDEGHHARLQSLATTRMRTVDPAAAKGAGTRIYRTWAGIAAVLTHDYDTAITRLEAALEDGDIINHTPEDVEALTFLAVAYRKAARDGDAENVIARAEAVLARASSEGFAGPSMEVLKAYVAAARGRDGAAAAHLEAAARLGWARPGQVLRHPAMGRVNRQASIMALFSRVRTRISGQHDRAVVLASGDGFPARVASQGRNL